MAKSKHNLLKIPYTLEYCSPAEWTIFLDEYYHSPLSLFWKLHSTHLCSPLKSNAGSSTLVIAWLLESIAVIKEISGKFFMRNWRSYMQKKDLGCDQREEDSSLTCIFSSFALDSSHISGDTQGYLHSVKGQANIAVSKGKAIHSEVCCHLAT